MKFYFNPKDCDNEELDEIIKLADEERKRRKNHAIEIIRKKSKYWFKKGHKTDSNNSRYLKSD